MAKDSFKPQFVNRLKTPTGRIAWPKLDKPDSSGQYPSNKYQAYLIFDEDANLKALKAACIECAKATWGDKVDLKKLQWPFRTGEQDNESDVKKGEYFIGRTFIFPKSKNRPLVVGPNSKPLPEGEDVRGGYWCRFAVTAMSYMSTEKVRLPNGKQVTQTVRGVTFLLEGVQKVREDETFSGGGVDADFFDDGEIDDEVDDMVLDEDDPSNYEDEEEVEGDEADEIPESEDDDLNSLM